MIWTFWSPDLQVSSYRWLDSNMWTCGHTRIHSVHSICLRETEWITVSLVISKLCRLAWGFHLMASVPASPGPNLLIKIYATQSWHGAQLYHRIISHFSSFFQSFEDDQYLLLFQLDSQHHSKHGVSPPP